MSENIYTEKKWVVYLTIYSGNLLPRRYIGYTSQERIDEGYNGSPDSKEYKSIYETEQKNNKHLFKTRVIKEFDTKKKEAKRFESKIQQKYGVVKSDQYFNMADGIAPDRSIAVIDPNGIVYESHTDASKVWGCTRATIANWLKKKVGWSNVEGDNISDEDKIKRKEEQNEAKAKRMKGRQYALGSKHPHTDEWKEAHAKQMKGKYDGAKHPQADLTIYHFIHKKSGETFTGTRIELMEAHPELNWHSGSLSAMINPNGKLKSHLGWSVVV